jgi:dTMP kinase
MIIIHNFVVFEGGDGSGTSTQLDLLGNRFTAPSLPPLYRTFEPTDGPLGRIIRSALQKDLVLQPETMARLFAADRNEHLYGPEGIIRRCGRGELVICDRYVLSSLVYQGITCGEALPRRLNEDFPGPELLLFFDIDPETAQRRLEGRPLRELYEYPEFQIQVLRRYRETLPWYRDQGVRVECIDASEPPEAVAGAVWRNLEKMPILRGV